MASRPNKRPRTRLSNSPDDSESNDDWMPTAPTRSSRDPGATRTSGRNSSSTSASVSSLDASKRSIRLTVKAPPSKLREVTNTGSQDDEPPRELVNARGRLARSSKNKRPIIDASSDEEDELLDELADNDVDDSQMAEDEEDEQEEDDDVVPTSEDNSPAPRSQFHQPRKALKPLPVIKLSTPGVRETRKPSPGTRLREVQSVEDKEIEMEDVSRDTSEVVNRRRHSNAMDLDEDEDADELSELDGEGDEDMDGEGEMDDEGGDGDDDEEDEEEEDDEDEDEELAPGELPGSAPDSESGSSTPEMGSRGGTPDLNKLTRRQRSAYEAEGGLMALSNEAQKKKFFTAEQITMRRAEMARRRKDLSEKRNEEEKKDTLKRLLEKPAPKRRSRAQVLADAEREEFGLGSANGDEEALDWNPPRPGCLRLVIGNSGNRVAVPEAWLAAKVGQLFAGDSVKAAPTSASTSAAAAAKHAGGTPAPKMVEVIE